MADIPIRPDAGGIVYQESITYAKAAASNSVVARLLAIAIDGEERVIGESAFHHTRTIEGPGEA